MTLLLREDDVRATLTMPETMRVVEAMFQRQGAGQIINQPRVRIVLPAGRGVTHVLPAWVPGQPGDPSAEGPGFVGLKTYTSVGGNVRFLVLLSSAEDGRMLAMVEANLLGQMRTGAASGVATRHMARENASVVAILGAGGQARTQALAMATARSLSHIYVYARDRARVIEYCQEISATTGVEAQPTATAEEAVRAADIVVTATTSKEPVMRGEWLRAGAHVNAMGSNWGHGREVDTETVTRASLIAVDDLAQARIEAGDLLIPEREGRLNIEESKASGRLVELGAVVSGKAPVRRGADGITLFKSLGIGAEDIATAALVYKLARERGLGQEVEMLP